MPAPAPLRKLFQSPLVWIGDYRCSAVSHPAGQEEVTRAHEVVFVRSGLFAIESRGRRCLCDSTRVVFFTAGEAYRATHPAGCHDSCTVLRVAPAALLEIASRRDPGAPERPLAPFAGLQAPCSPRLLLAHRRLLSQAASGTADCLALEERTLAIVSNAMAGPAPSTVRVRAGERADTHRAHRELAESACVVLARRWRDAVSVAEVARTVHSSPYHLCRVFRLHMGLSMQRYRNRLRLAAGLERLADRREEQSQLAVDLGFADQSHFANAFRREFGIPPGAWRKVVTARAATQLSKKLQDPHADLF